MTTQDISSKIIPVLKSQGVLKAALFGSMVQGDTKKGSDVDLLVELADDKRAYLILWGLNLTWKTF